MAAKIEKRQQAESERFKGNEFMREKDFAEAIKCYTKAIDLNPNEAATYSNRAMAYLKMKVYPKVIEDANKAIELDPVYVKAYHRRGKAYLATKKYALAIPDFQFILEKNPDDKDINACLKEARQALNIAEPKVTEVTEDEPKKEQKKGFRKVAIASDSEESEEEQENVQVNSNQSQE